MAAVAATPLDSGFKFSYMRRGKAAAATTTKEGEQPATPTENVVHPYENSIKTLATVDTVEEFWSVYDYLKRPNTLPTTTDYHFFRSHIKPTWEDKGNEKGGKWIIRLPKGLASRYFEEILLAIIGNQVPGVTPDEICGVVISIRYSEDILGIWNKTADREVIGLLRDAIKKVLQLPPQASMEYKPHQTSIQDKSSFRNTQVWKPKSAEGRERSDSRGEPTPRRSSGSAWTDERKKSRGDKSSWR
ncbi:4E type 2 [Seminavis robusta]|uniref:4E type 2 n=1 Tax=Seminavis robusta TaxID=568900 RepID=A0A9N8E7J3_9STRA|nr:4E type 2 [Seminavis robusta]|eukprot:Sro767_g199490.1 4E type 2 (245) ;mRNA; r:33041-34074